MTAAKLVLRSLVYFKAPHTALLAGMMLVTAVLTGALILGDSVRDSLADLTQRRRGGYEIVATSPGWFSQSLADRAAEISGRRCDGGLVFPGRVRSERTTLSGGAQLVSIPRVADVPRHAAWITRSLAESLQVRNGDTLLVTLPTGSSEAVLARRDRTAALASLRVMVDRVLDERATAQPAAFLAWFDLHPSQRAPANLWLNLADLQDALQEAVPAEARIPQAPANMLLAGPVRKGFPSIPFPPPSAMKLEDYGLGFSHAGDLAILHSGRIYISAPIAKLIHAVTTGGLEVYTLLLDQIATDDPAVPPLNYVIATGISGSDDFGLKDNQAAVNRWMADQLHIKIGDVLHLKPYRLETDGTVAVAASTPITVTRIVPMSGLGADPTLTPIFHGLTDADTIADWNPPAGFPFDRARVTPADEAYWDQYKASPKIFFNLATAQRLMGSTGELTSVRVPAAQAADFQRSVLNALTPDATGFASRSFAADQPANTDFAGLFLGLSGFLLIAAILLVVLLFRLAVEQRTRQMGLLGALGFTPARIARMILAEGSLVALLGMLAGLPLAVMYTRLLVSGLGTLWIGATGTRAIGLHIHGLTLLIGGATSLVAAVSALALTAWRVARSTPIAQLHGLGVGPSNHGPRRPPVAIAIVGMVVAVAPVAVSSAGYLDPPIAFLSCGFLMLSLAIIVLATLPAASRRVRATLPAIAAASILRQRTRAILCVALMAAAAFLLTSVTAFQSSPTEPAKPPSPTGSYQLIITTQIPLPADLQTPAGRKLLGVPESPLFASTCFTPLRVKIGDDLSCLNMMRPASATLVGVPPDVLKRLAISSSLKPPTPVLSSTLRLRPEGRYAEEPDSSAPNPALRSTSEPASDASIPAAVDEQTAQYILHAGLGDRIPEPATTRPIVIDRLLTDSIFQSYALIPDQDFHQAFPAVTRPSLILVDCPPSSVPELQEILRRHLDDFGVTVETTPARLAAYHAVADSYIAAFQLLGALALLVGTLGLVVVLARNVIQRRAELSLLLALGFTRHRITLMLVIEHGLLLLMGLALGVLTALVAIGPQMRQVHFLPVAVAIGVILISGLVVLTISSLLSTRSLTPAALRQE